MITELRHAAERRYMNLAEAVPLSVWTADPGGSLNYVNRYWTEYTGIGLTQARGSAWLDAVHPDDRAECVQAWRAAIRSGTPYQRECRLRRASDGAYRWHLSRAVAERQGSGEIVSWLGLHTDIEESKQAVRARDEFLSIASHELRTPLTALKLRLQAVLHSKELPDKAQHRVTSAVRQTERLERLIENLLDVSRITTGHLELEPETLDLSELAQEVVERFREQAACGNVPIEVRTDGAVVGCWDRLRIEQVATNLLSNALKFGEGRPIIVQVHVEDGKAVMSVADQGIGIAPRDLERIFNQFERIVGHRSFGGLGMGLYIVRQIVDAHGGKIEVETAQREGATFRVSLPL